MRPAPSSFREKMSWSLNADRPASHSDATVDWCCAEPTSRAVPKARIASKAERYKLTDMEVLSRPTAPTRVEPVLWDVVSEHLSEAEFLFGQWQQALRSPRYTMTELRETVEERLQAHL